MLGHQMRAIRRIACLAAAAVLGGALLALPAPKASAQETAAFLKIGVGARAVGMGRTYTAVADDADALYWNPGGLSQLDRIHVGAMHAQMFQGDVYDAVSLAVPLGSRMELQSRQYPDSGKPTATTYFRGLRNRGVLAFGITRLGQASQQGRDAQRRQTGDFDASDMSMSVAYARPLTNGIHLGLGLKRIESRIADSRASAMAADLGLMFRPRSRWQFGASVQNLGRGMRFERETSPLPLNYAVGAAFRAMPGFLLAGEVQHRPHAKRTSWSIGTEYAILSAFSLRAGYLGSAAGASSSGGSPLSGLGGGFGVKWGRYSLDYALTPFGALGNVQRLSIQAKF